jgi:hypothetical protein
VGVSNSHSITALSNGGVISGGQGGRGVTGGAGGAGVQNSGTIVSLTNTGTISGGQGAMGSESVGGAGGTGISNEASGVITALTNSGLIKGGLGGAGGAAHGVGGTGIISAGAIGTLTNTGIIDNGMYAIRSTGSIGLLANGGQIIGNVAIENQARVTITGGSGEAFGSFNGGAITIGGDLTFARGGTDLADDITVHDGAGTATNEGVLRLATHETITGNFDQREGGARSTSCWRATSLASTARCTSPAARRCLESWRST